MKGYRADTYSQIERLVFMAFFEREHAVFCRNLEAQITEPVLKSLIGRIAKDEERHEEFFANLVAHCLTYSRDETIEAIARRAAELDVVGGDIDAYADKVAHMAEAGIFGPEQLRQVIADRITAWGLADEPALRSLRVTQLATARLHGAIALSESSVVSRWLATCSAVRAVPIVSITRGPAPVLVPQCPPRGSCGAARARGALRD